MLVVYDYDSNFIHVEPMPNKSGPAILAAYERAHKLLCSRGLKPVLQRLDNEASEALQSYMTDEGVDFQLASPYIHRRNAAERAVQTFKHHLIAGMCSTDRNFPLHLWDRLIPQAIISLNRLRTSRISPRLSAYAQVHGAFDYSRTPLAPPGTREARQWRNVGTACDRRLVHWPGAKTLPLLPGVHQRNLGRTCGRHPHLVPVPGGHASHILR